MGGGLGTGLPDVAARRQPEVLEEQPGQVPLADARLGRQRGGGEVVAQVRGDVVDGPLDQAVGRGRRVDEHAHLRLVAGPLQVGDQVAGDGPGQFGAVVLLDEGQGEIERGGDAGRGGDVAVPDEDRVGVDDHVGVAGGHPLRLVPVGGGAPPVEQAGRGQDERTRADGGHTPALAGQPAHVTDDQRVGGGVLVADPARHHERVERPCDAFEGELGVQGQRRRGGDGVAAGGRHAVFVVGLGAVPVGALQRRADGGDLQ